MKKLLGIWVLILGVLAVYSASNAQAVTQNVHSFQVENMEGEQVSLSDYDGKALLIVNTASKCGFTRQYRPMEKLYQKYKDKGFEVLAFPANNFGGQEPGSNEEIKNFCFTKYKTTFPLFAKSSVKGSDITPLYKYLTEESGFTGPVSWNFTKFLVDPKGNVIARYTSGVDPLSEDLVQKLESVLPNS